MGTAGQYDDWTQQQLIARIQELERKAGEARRDDATVASSLEGAKPLPFRKAPKAPLKAFDASKYSTRLIALKFAYLGQKYNGFEHHKNNSTPLPTVEEEVWKALVKTRLIQPVPTARDATEYNRLDKKTFASWERDGADVNWDGCEYSKCGRTDRGVSASGQVIGVRVRSSKPLPAPESNQTAETRDDADEEAPSSHSTDSEPDSPVKPPFNDPTDELPYIQLLNRVLPPDIRIYAWCPNPPSDFNARFSCKERRYKYFFTNPCFAPVPGSSGLYNTPSTPTDTMREGWLDIEAMQRACNSLIGLHDFRNFCKIDASKQLSNFTRRIFHASIDPVSPLTVPSFLAHPVLASPSSSTSQEPRMYAFTLHGSAFLWHQVRSIVAILFLIGQRLESPELIPALLDISANPTRPKYDMASDAPLVLWDCIFPSASDVQIPEERKIGYQDALDWVYVGDEGAMEPKSRGYSKGGGPISGGRGKWGRGGVIDDVWEVWRGAKVDETLAALLLDRVAAQGTSTLDQEEVVGQHGGEMAKGGPRIFDGGDVGKAKGEYVPVLQRERQEPVELVNERYARRKGWDASRARRRDEDAGE